MVWFETLWGKELVEEAKYQIGVAWPISLSFLLRMSVDVISVIFVGHINRDYLAGVGLAAVTCNVTGYSMLIGLSGGLATQAGIAKGAQNERALILALQRMFFLMMIQCCLISIVWFHLGGIITALGQNETIAATASRYIRVMIPGLWCYAVSCCLQVWIYAQSDTKNIAIVAALQTFLHPFTNYWLIYTCDMGWIGAAWASSLSKLIYAVALLGYLQYKYINQMGMPVFRLSAESFTEFTPILKLSLPSILMMSEWWASEIIIFLAGLLDKPELHLAAMSVYQNTCSFCFMIPAGLQVSGSTIIGNALGAGNPTAARRSTANTMRLSLGVGILSGLGLLAVRNSWGRLFTSDEDVVHVVSQLLFPLAIYVVADSTQCGLTGVIKGAGKQSIGGPVVLVAYYIIGLPMATWFAFPLGGYGWDLGVIGLCIGTSIGTWTHMLIYFHTTATMDWDHEAREARSKLGTTGSHNDTSTVYSPLKSEETQETQVVEVEMSSMPSSIPKGTLYDGAEFSIY